MEISNRVPVAQLVSQFVLPVVSGLLVALCFPPFDLWWLAWVALVPLGLSVSLSNRILKPLIGAFMGCAVLHLIGLDWIRTSFRGSGLSGPWGFAWLTWAFLASPAWVAAVGVTHVLFHRLALPMAVALSAGWIAGEFAVRGIALFFTETDFPWLQLAATQTHLPSFIQVADIVGGCGVGGLVAFANGTLCDVLLSAGYRRKVRAIVTTTIVFAFVCGYGAWRLSQPDLRRGPTVCLMPWRLLPEMMSDPSSLHQIADILLWTEGAIRDDEATDTPQTRDIERFAKATDALVAIGWRRIRSEFTANSLALADPSKGLVDIYDKTYLVPWAEFSPWIKIPYIPGRDAYHRASTGHRTFLCAGARMAPAICYDVCLPAFLRRFESPDMFVIASAEEADDTKRLPAQVAQIVRLRAIEFRRAIVRNVRGGHSGVIDGCGRVRWDFEDIEQPVVVGPVPIDEGFSVYAMLGDTVVAGPLVLFVAVVVVRRQWRKRQERRI